MTQATTHTHAPENPAQCQQGLPDDEAPHILIIDDDRRIRELLKTYLQENGYRITTAEGAGKARKRLQGLEFDLLVLDVMMPGETGLELTRSLREHTDVPILLLTALAETGHRIEGLEHGADDYLSKPFEPRELLLRITTILKRTLKNKALHREVTFGPYLFDTRNGRLLRHGTPVRLTEGETRLLQIFSRQAGKPVSREALRDQVHDSDEDKKETASSERAIDVQINRLRRKIERDPKNPLYLQTIRGAGYIFRPD